MKISAISILCIFATKLNLASGNPISCLEALFQLNPNVLHVSVTYLNGNGMRFMPNSVIMQGLEVVLLESADWLNSHKKQIYYHPEFVFANLNPEDIANVSRNNANLYYFLNPIPSAVISMPLLPDLIPCYFCFENSSWVKIQCVKGICKQMLIKNFDSPALTDFMNAKLAFATPTLTKTSSQTAHMYIRNEKIITVNLALNLIPVLVTPEEVDDDDDGNSWEDLANYVESSKVDACFAPSIVLAYRTAKIRFLLVHREEILRAYYQPEVDGSIHDITVAGFNFNVWCVVFLQILIFAGCLQIFIKFEFGESLEASIGMFSLQGLDLTAKCKAECVSSRIFIFIATFSAWLLTIAFSGCLIANLANNEIKITSLSQLVRRGYTFGFKNNDSYLYASFSVGNSRNTEIGKIIQSPRFRPFYKTSESRAALKADRMLVILSEKNLYTRSTKLSGAYRNLVVVGERVKLAGIVRRGSKLSDSFNYALIRHWESGLKKRLTRYEELADNIKEPRKYESPRVKMIRLQDASVPFMLLLMSFGFSFVSSMIERITEYYTNKKLFLL